MNIWPMTVKTADVARNLAKGKNVTVKAWVIGRLVIVWDSKK